MIRSHLMNWQVMWYSQSDNVEFWLMYKCLLFSWSEIPANCDNLCLARLNALKKLSYFRLFLWIGLDFSLIKEYSLSSKTLCCDICILKFQTIIFLSFHYPLRLNNYYVPYMEITRASLGRTILLYKWSFVTFNPIKLPRTPNSTIETKCKAKESLQAFEIIHHCFYLVL